MFCILTSLKGTISEQRDRGERKNLRHMGKEEKEREIILNKSYRPHRGMVWRGRRNNLQQNPYSVQSSLKDLTDYIDIFFFIGLTDLQQFWSYLL